MNASFQTRMAALAELESEADERTAALAPSELELTPADLDMLLYQVAIENVRIDDGRAIRRWACNHADATIELDVALYRVNRIIDAEEDNAPRDTVELLRALGNLALDAEESGDSVPTYVWGLLMQKFPAAFATEDGGGGS
jgi:hypothetical protein